MFQNINELPELRAMLEGGYVATRQHPSAPLMIYNYTAKAQYENVWNAVTLACRGLICDLAGNVVARPFSKFFNLDQVDTLPDEPFEVYEKLDGSLGILYWVDGQPCIATRGSFDGEQARWATQWFRDQWWGSGKGPLYRDCTYLFEIIYPANRIVVNYGDRAELVLLAVIDTKTGEEYPSVGWGFKTARRFDGITSLEELALSNIPNFEGFVARFANGLRVKVKLGEYVRLHKLITGINEKFVLESLMNGDDLAQVMEQVPDEFNVWLRNTIAHFKERYTEIETAAKAALINTSAGSRKEYAEAFKRTHLVSILFAMLDSKDYSRIIWRMVAVERRWEGAPRMVMTKFAEGGEHDAG